MLIYFAILIISISIIGCGGKKNPDPDSDPSPLNQLINETQQTEILGIFADTVEIVQAEHFYKFLAK